MGMHDDLLDHLVAEGIGAKWNGTTGVLLQGRIQPKPDTAVFVKGVQGFKNIRGMGPSMGPPLGGERPSFEVTVRGLLFVPTETFAGLVNTKLDHFTGILNGTDYKYIEALFPMHYVGIDENNRHLFFCRYRITKDRG